jgi:hypothetical protein
MEATMDVRRPRFVRVKEAVAYSGVSRARLYQWGHEYPKLFRKNRGASFIDLDVVDAIHNGMPIAEFCAPPPDAT